MIAAIRLISPTTAYAANIHLLLRLSCKERVFVEGAARAAARQSRRAFPAKRHHAICW